MLNEMDSGEPKVSRDFRLTPLNISVGALLIIALLGGVILYVRSGTTTIMRIQEAKRSATTELDQIKSPPGSVFVRRGTTASGEHGTVTDYYRSQQTYDGVRNHYVNEFERLGWKFEGENGVPVRGRDVGAIKLRFCKNGNSGNVFFVGKQETADNITYTVGTSWGLGCRSIF